MGALRLVTDRAWMRDELSRNTVMPVKSSFGYEIPEHDPDDIWWIPQGIGTRFLMNGVDLRPQAPGPYWLDWFDFGPAGRGVYTREFSEIDHLINGLWHDRYFWKFAEAKVDWFPAQVFSRKEDAMQLLRKHGVPGDAMLQLSDPLALGNEYRFFVRDGKIVTSSIYLMRPNAGSDEGAYTYYDLLDHPEVIPPAGERQLAGDFLQDALAQLKGPDGYVVDVAFLDSTQPCILEANPAWCSAWYGCDINEVVETVVASYRPSKWQWSPDPILTQRYTAMQPLPRAH